MKVYSSKHGWQYAVRPVLGEHVYIVMRRMAGERWQQGHVLPWLFANKQEAEDELERWAAKKGMKCKEESDND